MMKILLQICPGAMLVVVRFGESSEKTRASYARVREEEKYMSTWREKKGGGGSHFISLSRELMKRKDD